MRLYHGDVRQVLAGMPDASVDCIVTSPPYWQLRDYGYSDQIGLEPTIEEYVEAIVGVFRDLRRVLAPYGTCWLNLGDSFAGSAVGGSRDGFVPGVSVEQIRGGRNRNGTPASGGLKPKDLCLIPFRVALALQADGWWIRQRNIWAKPNPMPESVQDRTTSAAEEVFHLTKIGAGYYYDAEAVREVDGGKSSGNGFVRPHRMSYGDRGTEDEWTPGGGRNLRNVWTIATEPTPEAHFATFPLALVERCLLAGCPKRVCRECGEPSRRVVERDRVPDRVDRVQGREVDALLNGHGPDGRAGNRYAIESTTLGWTDCGHDAYRPGIVLDPFVGSGKTCQQARRMGLHSIGIDGSEEYLAIAKRRLQDDRARSWVADGDRPVIHDDQLAMEW